MSINATTTIFVGTYTRQEPHVDGKAKGIYVYELDHTTGALIYKSVVSGVGTVNPSFLTITQNCNYLVAVNEVSEGATASLFSIAPETHTLQYINQQLVHGQAPCFVSMDASGRFALVANYSTGNICALPILPDGRLGEISDMMQFHGSGSDMSRQDRAHAHMIVPVPNSDLVAVVDLGSDRIWLCHFDDEQGKFTAYTPDAIALPEGTGARHLVFHPQLPVLYVISELQSTILAYRYANDFALVQPIQTITTLPDDYSGENWCAEIQISSDGRFVYGSNRGHDSIVTYAVDSVTGELSTIQHMLTQGEVPRHFTLDQSGKWLLVANQNSDNVVTFHVDQDNGKLGEVASITHVPTPVCIVPLDMG